MIPMAGNPDDWPEVYAPEAFDAQIGKTVPVRLRDGGPVIGTATILPDGQAALRLYVDQGTEPPPDTGQTPSP